ncbi:eukaryotic translation initiation factor 2-alpha kinase [Microplitis demolitor]|uniref:eukaryotic translation initiation factor 2-alpha kinase n=1 Tax=Microplitis demolitor TaxID=69319 RepID=UPI0006D4E757|nr:eukaryotic translation initiation factor 2-alpha kinase [Microplitis demolitor]
MWRWSCFKRKISLILLIIITPNVIGENDNISHDIEPIRACGSSADDLPSSRLVFISTLDGKLTALDILNNGEKKWALDFDDIPLISSSIHKRELNDDGHWVKLIPSLNGRLYKFDGDTVEQIPVTTDHLLQSSFRYSDNLVFSGGKEIQTYGVTSNNGKILYHCTINGCNNNTDGDRLYDDVLIIQRLQQTIRAVEPATGTEKWNYSVGTHELNLVATERPCFQNPNHHNNHYEDDNIDIKVIIPQGLIWAIDKSNPTKILWRYQFDTPIVTVWQQTHNYGANGHYYDAIKELNLFDNKQWSWGQDYPTDPSIYVGMHERQVYVQESKSRKFFELSDLTNNDNNKHTKIIDNHNNINNIYPWKPYPAHESSILRIENSGNKNEISNTKNVEDSTAAGLSILYNSGYVDGNGYYLYTQNHQEQSANCNKTSDNSLSTGSESSEPVLKDAASETTGTPAADKESLLERIIASLGWIEITALIFALIGIYLTKHITSNSDVGWSYSLPIIVEKYIDPVAPSKDPAPANNENNNVEFNSLYSAGFETINCLGKGGYGVVFEAKNKIDDCHYAIKRISLPDTQNSRDRVMREVKALAKLDHQNIVRYFHAWFECPPVGWQEKHDTVFINQQLSQSLFTTEDSCIDSGTVDTATCDTNSVCIDVAINGLDLIDNKITDDHNVSRSENDDSFIVFDTDKSISTEESDQISDGMEDDMENDCVSVKMEKSLSDSVVFQLGSSSGDKNLDGEEEETDETEDENQKNMAVKNKTKKRDRHKKSTMFFYIQMQLCQRLSLQDWLKSPNNFSRNRNEIISIFQQIVDAVEYVHLQGMIHRDLKPSNILFSYDNKIKIGDFGLVTAMTEDDGISCKDIDNAEDADDDSGKESNRRIKKHTANVGTHLYMSPEQINGVIYDYKVDIYSLGIILFELLVPFTTGMERMVTLGNLKKNIFPDDFAVQHPKEYNLLTMMLDKDPRKRPTAIGIKARPPLSSDQSITDTKYHFTLPHISRNSSSISSSNSAQSIDFNNST